MLNRRYLRIKALQALYSFFRIGEGELPKSERELMRSIDKTYELYIYLLLFFPELKRVAQHQIEINKNKHLPTKEDLNPNMRFVENRLIAALENHALLQREAEARKLTWQRDEEMEMARKIWDNIRKWDVYKDYMNAPESSFESDRDFIVDLFKKHVADSDELEQFIEEINMHWPGDLNMAVAPAIIKTLENVTETRDLQLAPLFKDPEDDRQFVLELFRRTIVDNEKTDAMIAEKTKNWEVDRIAVMDVLLMKMAITELLHFQSIPVKVTLNEYIEISKLYSTPKSKQFINGILDKMVADFRTNGEMVKTGRGLME
ncbi:MAG: transcription antitermination factor NusB [Bacteroidia bacterium]